MTQTTTFGNFILKENTSAVATDPYDTKLYHKFERMLTKLIHHRLKSVTLNDMDSEIAELMYKTVRKLEAMTDAEFEELYIMPDGMVDD